MPNRKMNLYHVTPYATAVRILDSGGIDPKKAQGRRNVTWLVSKQMVPWAIAHVAQRHGLGIEDLAVLHVKVDTSLLLRTSRRSVYCSSRVLKPLQMDSAAIWLQRQETRVFLRPRVVRGNGFVGTDPQEEDELSEL